MTVTTKLFEESREQGGFYVPRYEVKIEGANLPRDVLFDVQELTYEDDVESIDSFRMTVNNWDDRRREFKYIGSETEAQLRPGHPVVVVSFRRPEVVVRINDGNTLATRVVFAHRVAPHGTRMEPVASGRFKSYDW